MATTNVETSSIVYLRSYVVEEETNEMMIVFMTDTIMTVMKILSNNFIFCIFSLVAITSRSAMFELNLIWVSIPFT